MKKLLALSLVVVVVLAGCSNSIPDSKNGSKYVDYYYETIEKDSPEFSKKINDVTKTLKIDDEIENTKEFIKNTITNVLEPMPDQVTEILFEEYKKLVDQQVGAIDFAKGLENINKIIEDAKTNLEQAKADFESSSLNIFSQLENIVQSVIPAK